MGKRPWILLEGTGPRPAEAASRSGGRDRMRRFAVVFSVAGVRRALLGALLGRLAQSMYPIALLLTIRQTIHSFSLAGLVVSCFGVAVALSAPLLGRLVDRHAVVTMGMCALIGPLCVGGIVVAALTGHPVWLLVTAIAAGAAQPPITPALRSLLARSFTDERSRTTAFGVDAVSVEAAFVVGPAVVGGAVAWAAPQDALLAAAALTAVATVVFLFAKPFAERAEGAGAMLRSAGRLRAMRTLWKVILAGFAQMLAVGMVEVGTTARAVELGAPAIAGLCLAVWAAGAVIGGMVFSAGSWPGGLRLQYTAICLLMMAGLGLLAVPADPVFLLTLMLVAGLATTPAVALASTALSGGVAGSMRTEAFAWFTSMSTAGGSLGILLGGRLADELGARPVFLLSAVLPACAATAMAAGLPRTDREPRT